MYKSNLTPPSKKPAAKSSPVLDVPVTIATTGGATAGLATGTAIGLSTTAFVGPFSLLITPATMAAGLGIGLAAGGSAGALYRWFKNRAEKKLALKDLEDETQALKLEIFLNEVSTYVSAIEAAAVFIFQQQKDFDEITDMEPESIISEKTFMQMSGWTEAEKKLQHLIFKTMYAKEKGERLQILKLSETFKSLLSDIMNEKALNYLSAEASMTSKRMHTLSELIALDPIEQIQELTLYKTPDYIARLTNEYIQNKPEPDKTLVETKEAITLMNRVVELEDSISKLHHERNENFNILNDLVIKIRGMQNNLLDSQKSLKLLSKNLGILAKTQTQHIEEAEKHMTHSEEFIEKSGKDMEKKSDDLKVLQKSLSALEKTIEDQSHSISQKRDELEKTQEKINDFGLFK